MAEVAATGGTTQDLRTRSTQLEQVQQPRETPVRQSQDGVEVRIDREGTQRAQNSEDLTYENLRPRTGSAPQAERNAEPRAADRAPEPQAEEVIQEEAQARESSEARRTSDSATALT